MCNYDGGNVVVVRTELPMPTSFSISRHQLFWMNKKGEVSTMVKNKEEVYKEVSVCEDCTDVGVRFIVCPPYVYSWIQATNETQIIFNLFNIL